MADAPVPLPAVPLPAAPVPDAAPAQSATNGGRFAVALKFSRNGSDIAVEVGAPTKEIAIDLAEEAARLARGIQKRRVGFQPKVGRTPLSGGPVGRTLLSGGPVGRTLLSGTPVGRTLLSGSKEAP